MRRGQLRGPSAMSSPSRHRAGVVLVSEKGKFCADLIPSRRWLGHKPARPGKRVRTELEETEMKSPRASPKAKHSSPMLYKRDLKAQLLSACNTKLHARKKPGTVLRRG